MASAIYPKAKEKLMTGKTIDLVADDIQVSLINTSAYTYGAGHTNYATEVAVANAVIGTAQALPATKSCTSGVYNTSTATLQFTAVTSAYTVSAIVIWDNTVTPKQPIAYIDGFTPIVPNGGNITITWDTGTNKIFTL